MRLQSFENFLRNSVAQAEWTCFPILAKIQQANAPAAESREETQRPRLFPRFLKADITADRAPHENGLQKSAAAYSITIHAVRTDDLRTLCAAGLDVSALMISDNTDQEPALLAIPSKDNPAVQAVLRALQSHARYQDVAVDGAVYAAVRHFDARGREVFREYQGNTGRKSTSLGLSPHTGLTTDLQGARYAGILTDANATYANDRLLGYWPGTDALSQKFAVTTDPGLLRISPATAQQEPALTA